VSRVNDSKATALILAGGESKRMGFPKLLLEYQGQNLLAHAIRKARTVSERTLVVVGAYPDLYKPLAEQGGATVLENPNWSEGLASSLRLGVAALKDTAQAALVILPDQPFVAAEHLQKLLDTWQRTGAALVFSRYAGVVGAPCVIDKSCFARVATLKGDKGARALLNTNATSAEVELTDFADVDTPEEARVLDTPS
jgi:molybdenum cofactor cytidylyltransferase